MAQELDKVQKAAVFFMSLGKEEAAEIIKHLPDSDVRKLSKAFVSLKELQRTTQLDIASEFQQLLVGSQEDVVAIDGTDFARDIVENVFKSRGKNSDSLLDFINNSQKEPLAAVIADIPDMVIESLITSEHPQTIAFLLTVVKPALAAKMLAKMTEELQVDVLVRVSNLSHVKQEVVDEVREALQSQRSEEIETAEDGVDGTKVVAEILNLVGRENEERLLTELEELYPETAEQIRNLMFTFEDLLKLDDRAMQGVLKEIPREKLVMSLKLASSDLSALIFRNMSQRAAQMIQEDLESLGPQKRKDVEAAQQEVIDVVRRLEAEGKIQLATGGADDQMI